MYATSFIPTSDARLKENISGLGSQLAALEELRPVQYKLKDRAGTHIGLIAQDLQNTPFSNLVVEHTHSDGEKVLGINYIEMIPPLIKAVQELSARIVVLEGRGRP